MTEKLSAKVPDTQEGTTASPKDLKRHEKLEACLGGILHKEWPLLCLRAGHTSYQPHKHWNLMKNEYWSKKNVNHWMNFDLRLAVFV